MPSRACLTSGGMLVVLAGLYYAIVHTFTRIPLGGDVLLTIFCTVFLSMLLSGVADLLNGGRDRAAFQRAEGREPLQEGRLEAVTGPMVPLGEALVSPLQQVPCVAYEYEVTHVFEARERAGEGDVRIFTDFHGFGLTPAVIRSARGEVAVHGCRWLNSFAEQVAQGPAARLAQAYFAATPLEERRLGQTLPMTGGVTLSNYKNDGVVRKDYRNRGATLRSDSRFGEKVVRAGEAVTVLGYYSAKAHAFVPRDSWNALNPTQNQLFRGDPQAARKQAAQVKMLSVAIALVGLVFSHAVLYYQMLAVLGR